MNYYVKYIEKLCKENGFSDLPALYQLRKAFELKNEEDVNRISQNILFFIESKNKKTIPYMKTVKT